MNSLLFRLICVLYAATANIKAFNLEPRIALVKKGPKGSYFGLAVSPHQILVNDNRIDSTLLVGAPLDTYGVSKGDPSKESIWVAVLVWSGRKPSPKFCSTRDDLTFPGMPSHSLGGIAAPSANDAISNECMQVYVRSVFQLRLRTVLSLEQTKS